MRRLLAGLTRRILFLWLVHLSASGPSGIRASSATLCLGISVISDFDSDRQAWVMYMNTTMDENNTGTTTLNAFPTPLMMAV